MNFYLLTTYHKDKSAERHKELLTVLKINMSKPFKKVFLFGEQPFEDTGWTAVEWVVKQGRPYFSDFLTAAGCVNDPNGIFVMANADIFFQPYFFYQLEELYKKPGRDRVFLNLSRWDVYNFKDENMFEPQPFLRPDSSDCWVFKGIPLFLDAPVKIGIPGVDNKIPMLANNAGYRVVNPAWDIKVFHLHITNVRNYSLPNGEVIERYGPPYLMVEPTRLANLNLS